MIEEFSWKSGDVASYEKKGVLGIPTSCTAAPLMRRLLKNSRVEQRGINYVDEQNGVGHMYDGRKSYHTVRERRSSFEFQSPNTRQRVYTGE